jgi:hypothetical protein
MDIIVDILIAIALAYATIKLTFMGVQVNPKQKAEFFVIGCAILFLIAWQAYRSADLQSSLKTELSELRGSITHSHIRMRIATIAVGNMNEVKPGFNPFIPGERAMFNVTYRNVGTSNMRHVGPSGTVILTEEKPDIDAIISRLESAYTKEMKGEDLVPQEEKFFTPQTRILTDSDVLKIQSGKMRILVVGIVRFADSTGYYQQGLCSYLQPPGDAPVWHGCHKHESEIKLDTKSVVVPLSMQAENK